MTYGLVTDMNAIRRDEELDNLHSIYVDQWDWEKADEHSLMLLGEACLPLFGGEFWPKVLQLLGAFLFCLGIPNRAPWRVRLPSLQWLAAKASVFLFPFGKK